MNGNLITSFPGQQFVSDIAHLVKGSLITWFPMTNSKWVTFTFCERWSHHIFSMTNSLWVMLHMLWKAVSPHLFLWPTGCEYIAHFVKGSLITSSPMTNRKWVHCTFCGRHIFYYEQEVSSIANFLTCILSIAHSTNVWYIITSPVCQKVSMLPYPFCVIIIIIDCKISF